MKKRDYHVLNFNGVFSGHLVDYIELNRAVGNKYNVDAEYLMQFDRYCVQNGITELRLAKELLDGWCQKRAHETDTSHHIRVRVLRRFSKHLANVGVEAPAAFHKLPRLTRNYLPYIFTHSEMSKFLAASDHVRRSGQSPLAHLILPVLFRILYCCGLRVSEALNLQIPDVDLENGTLLIVNGKFDKDRLVPMSGTLTALCREYRANMPPGSDYFFPAPDKGPYSSCTIYTRFREILWQAGIPHGGRHRGPRLHDIRHTFAVHSLNNWVQKGMDIYTAIPILCTYLGHKNLSSTQRYLRLTPEVFPEVTEAFEAHFGSVFPEVRYEEI